MSETLKNIQNYIDSFHRKASLVISHDYQPTLSFKLSHVNNLANNCFLVESIEEAESIVKQYISTAVLGEIFERDHYTIDKDLFLTVDVKPS